MRRGEASLVASRTGSTLYLANPSNARSRGNFSAHASTDSGRTWPRSKILYPGLAAYSDACVTANGSLAFLFERDNYRYVSFGTTPALAPAR